MHIYRQLKLLNSLLSLRPSLHLPIFELLRTLLVAPQPESREQPSILAHLGGDEKYHIPLLIDLVTDPFTAPETRTAIWRYTSGVMASQQQGLAILLLFGAETGRKTANKPAVVEDKEEKETLLRKAVTMIVEDDLKMTEPLERQVFGTHPFLPSLTCRRDNGVPSKGTQRLGPNPLHPPPRQSPLVKTSAPPRMVRHPNNHLRHSPPYNRKMLATAHRILRRRRHRRRNIPRGLSPRFREHRRPPRPFRHETGCESR